MGTPGPLPTLGLGVESDRTTLSGPLHDLTSKSLGTALGRMGLAENWDTSFCRLKKQINFTLKFKMKHAPVWEKNFIRRKI